MTEETQGNEKESVFDAKQQEHIDKLIGKAYSRGLEKATVDLKAEHEKATADAERKELAASAEWEKLAEMHAARVDELELYEVEAKSYRELVSATLKTKVKTLGDAAKKAVGALPESMSDLDKLNWLNKNQELFETDARKVLGTPAAKLKRQGTKKERPEGHRRMRLS